MAKNPPEAEHVKFADANDFHQINQLVNITSTSFTNMAEPSHFDPEAFDSMDSLFSDTGNYQFYQSDLSTAGGPPAVLSVFDCAHSILSRVIAESPRSKFSKGNPTNEK